MCQRFACIPLRLKLFSIGLVILNTLIFAGSAESQEAQSNPRAMAPEARAFWNSEQSSKLGIWLADRMEPMPLERRPEWLLMFSEILQGKQLNAGDGWFRRPSGGTRFDWATVAARLDTDSDGVVSVREWTGSEGDFGAVDVDGDRLLTAADFEWAEHALAGGPGVGLYYLSDGDGNGKVSRTEFLELFDRLDEGGLGFLSRDELKEVFDSGTFNRLMMANGIKGGGPPPAAEGPDKATLVRGLFSQEIGSIWPGPEVGDVAPDFDLQAVDGDRDVQLSSYRARLDRPIVLIFGNFTCGPFRSQAGNLEKLHHLYRDRAGFLLVYVREAHPVDGWHMFDNFRHGYTLAQPASYDRRIEVAQQCRATLDLDLPMLVDKIDDPAGTLYSGMPARLYLIDREGKVAFKSGRGPFGFKPNELEQALALLLTLDDSQTDSASADPDVESTLSVPGP